MRTSCPNSVFLTDVRALFRQADASRPCLRFSMSCSQISFLGIRDLGTRLLLVSVHSGLSKGSARVLSMHSLDPSHKRAKLRSGLRERDTRARGYCISCAKRELACKSDVSLCAQNRRYFLCVSSCARSASHARGEGRFASPVLHAKNESKWLGNDQTYSRVALYNLLKLRAPRLNSFVNIKCLLKYKAQKKKAPVNWFGRMRIKTILNKY